MSLPYALLVALAEKPATGYDLMLRFRERLANVWPASHQHIYRELAKLLELGWLTVEAINQTERPDKKRYSLTPQGFDALRAWLSEVQPRPAVRHPLLIKFFAGEQLDLMKFQQELQAFRQETVQRLDHYLAIEQTFFSQVDTLPLHFQLQYLALRYGIVSAQADLNWLNEVERFVKPSLQASH